MRVLLLGATGLLGQAFVEATANRGWELRETARRRAPILLDIADAGALASLLEAEAPDVVVNCAALVDVAACERDPGLAYQINARPLSILADWSRSGDRPLVHVSTDHFFTTGGGRPHSEDEPVDLINEYARSKFAGEAFALNAPKALVLRTSILGIRNWRTPSFAEWAIASLMNGERMTLFSDAFTSSIDVRRFATAALDLLDQGAAGLLNLAAAEVFTKEQLVKEMARQLQLPLNAGIGTVSSLVPRRPACLGLDVTRAQGYLDTPLPGLTSVVSSVIAQFRENHAISRLLQNR
jgi:dTDP-4-dehydrorhamnose reductase